MFQRAKRNITNRVAVWFVIQVGFRVCGEKRMTLSKELINRGYYMAERETDFIFECWQYLFRVSESNEWQMFSTQDD